MRKKLLAIMFLAMCFTGGAYGFSPDKDGFITDWLVVGPFPKEGRWPICKGYFKDFLLNEGGEANIAPYPRMSHRAVFIPSKMPPIMVQLVTGDVRTLGWDVKEDIKNDISWQPYNFKTNVASVCNFKGMGYFIGEYIVAYGACYIEMKEDKKLKLKIGSDDGTKIWINHKFIGERHAHRAAKIDEDVYEVELKKGINLLLVKLEQDWDGWALALRFTEMDDKPLTDYNIYLTNPDFSLVDKITKPDKINMLAKEAAGYLQWDGTEDGTVFPGEIKGTLKLAAINPADTTVSVSITNEKKENIFSKDFALNLKPDKEEVISFSVNFPLPGKYNFAADVKNSGNLSREIIVSDANKAYEGYMSSLDKIEDLDLSVKQKDEELANSDYVIGTKEEMIDKRNKKIDSLIREVVKGKEVTK